GLSLRKVAAELARRGFYARNGATFAATQIRRMLAPQATQPEGGNDDPTAHHPCQSAHEGGPEVGQKKQRPSDDQSPGR
ncbi:MAG: hypothetical protein ACUVR3_11335, partial [Candidatus Roseilinea sp.]